MLNDSLSRPCARTCQEIRRIWRGPLIESRSIIIWKLHQHHKTPRVPLNPKVDYTYAYRIINSHPGLFHSIAKNPKMKNVYIVWWQLNHITLSEMRVLHGKKKEVRVSYQYSSWNTCYETSIKLPVNCHTDRSRFLGLYI